MSNDVIKSIIEDAHKLAKADIAPDLIKPCVETIALRLERLVKNGLYITPKAAMETIAGDRPLDAIFANPPLEGFAKFLSVPALGIRFNRHRSKALTTLAATWRDEANDHIYEVRVQPDGDTPNCGWRATATNDGHRVFTLTTKNRTNCEHFALSAMKRYLKRGHRRTYRTLAKANKEV